MRFDKHRHPTSGFPLLDPFDSTTLIVSIPDSTSPNTTCLPSRCGHGTVVTKN